MKTVDPVVMHSSYSDLVRVMIGINVMVHDCCLVADYYTFSDYILSSFELFICFLFTQKILLIFKSNEIVKISIYH